MYWLLYLINTTSTAPIRSCIRGRTQFFKIVGFAGKRFLLSPPPPPLRRLLGKESGSRKQVYLWQVGKASQWQYYLVKILQVNVFFTRFKNRPKTSYLQHYHKQWNFAKLWRKKSRLASWNFTRIIIPQKNPTVIAQHIKNPAWAMKKQPVERGKPAG